MRVLAVAGFFALGLGACVVSSERADVHAVPSYSAPPAGENFAYDIARSLTTEVGARLAGTAKEEEARVWAMKKLKQLNFRNVRVEPFTFAGWVRGQGSGELVSPSRQKLELLALGGSVETPQGGLTAPVAFVESFDELLNVPTGAYRGKIVYINDRMARARDGSGYGPAVRKRSRGAVEAAKRGAVGVLIRSAGTDSHRFAHTGNMRYDSHVKKIPAAALSGPDADQLERLHRNGIVPVVRLHLSPRFVPVARSGNVVGEIAGTEKPDEIVLMAAHLDSWDVGTGAIDDAAGVAIVIAAALKAAGPEMRPKRTLRVVLYGAEEVGVHGGDAYLARHAKALKSHIVAMEADFGAGRPWRYDTQVSDADLNFYEDVGDTLRSMGIERGKKETSGGADISVLKKAGVPVIAIGQDGTHYFDLHHTQNDTLDKIDPHALALNVEAYGVAAGMIANR